MIDWASALLKGEARRAGAAFGQGEELLFRRLDLLLAGFLDLGLGGLLHHLRADLDQLAPQGEVVHQLGVVVDLRAERRAVEQVGEIAGAADLGERGFMLEVLAQRHAVGDAPAGDHPFEDVENGRVGRRVEVARLQEIGHALVCVVVEQDRAQHRHFGRKVVRRRRLLREIVVLRHGPSVAPSFL